MDPVALAPGQENLGREVVLDGKSASKKPYLLTFRSAAPQRQPIPIPCGKGEPEAIHKTIAAEAKPGKAASPWAKSKELQRPVVKPPTDLAYPIPEPAKGPKVVSAFTSRTPRLPETPEPAAPPVGYYTSPLISAGMLP